MHEWRDHELLRRALDVFGLALARRGARGAAGARRAGAPPSGGARRRATSPRPTGCAPRSRPPAGRCATSPSAGYRLVRRRAVTREQVYGRRAVREALRGRREVLELWATERARRGRAVAAEKGPRLQVKPERELTEAAGTRDHQGVAGVVRAVPLRRRLRARGGGAAAARVPRPGHRPAQPRRGLPQRRGRGRDRRRRARARLRARDAGRLPRVGRRRRAPAGRRRHEPRALPERGEGRRPVGLRRGGRRRADAVGRRPRRAASRSSSARRARACARSCGARATARSRSRSPGRSSR